jgi:predicted metal-dependent hydrolase
MNINKSSSITVRNIPVQIVRKPIKNLHLGVYPPHGRVRVAAPDHITDDNVRLAVVSKLSWIKKQQASFAAQPRQSKREMVTGESVYLWGQRYRLEVVEQYGRHGLKIKNNSKLQLTVRPGTSRQNKEKVLNAHYRDALKVKIPELLEKWQPIIGRQAAGWGVKKMKTKWGSCNIEAQRIWLNLELAKKRPECLEYIVVHELVHLLERRHNERFLAHMNHFMPNWRIYRDVLKAAPLGHEDWSY